MKTSSRRVWPPAGSWIRRYFPRSGWATTRWHLFTGDVIWRLHWPGPSLETECGYATGPLWAVDDLNFVDDEPDAPCRLCLRIATGRCRRRRRDYSSSPWADAVGSPSRGRGSSPGP